MAASERTRLRRRRRALTRCAFIGRRRRAADAQHETWDDVRLIPPRGEGEDPPHVTEEEARAQLERLWNADDGPPAGMSIADRLAREEAAAAAATSVSAHTRAQDAQTAQAAKTSAGETTKSVTPGDDDESGEGGVGWGLWGMLASVDWAGVGAAAGSAGAAAGSAALHGAGTVGAALGNVEVQWSSQVNPDNDSTPDGIYDASVAMALKGCLKRHHRALRGQKAYWPGIESLHVDRTGANVYKAKPATERYDDDTDRPIGPLPPRMNAARA